LGASTFFRLLIAAREHPMTGTRIFCSTGGNGWSYG
jgi:hypothetical protein